MDVQHGLGREAARFNRFALWRRTAPLHPAFSLQLALQSLDMHAGKLSHRYVPEPRNDVLLHDAAVARRGARGDAPLNIGFEPMPEILREGHLRGIDIAPLIALTEQSSQFLLRFALRAAERHILGGPLPGQWIAPEIELHLPRISPLLSYMSTRH